MRKECQLIIIIYEYIMQQYNEIENEYIQLINNTYQKKLCCDDYMQFIKYTVMRDVKFKMIKDIENLMQSFCSSDDCINDFRKFNNSIDSFYIR